MKWWFKVNLNKLHEFLISWTI